MKNSKNIKSNAKFNKIKEDKEKNKKEQIESKTKDKEDQYKRLEEYANETGLSLAFNIIFAELISKQILPENFFTYTSIRLKQIGNEIEGLKTKETINPNQNEVIDDKKEENIDDNKENENKLFEANNKEEDVLLTVQKKKKKA